MDSKDNNDKKPSMPVFTFNFDAQKSTTQDNKSTNPPTGGFKFTFGSNQSSDAKSGGVQGGEPKKFVFNFTQPKQQAIAQKVAQFSKKLEKVEEEVLCEQTDVKGYYLETITNDDQTKCQQWSEYDVGLHLQLLSAKGEGDKQAQKVFVVKLQIKQITKQELGEDQQQEQHDHVQKLIVKMAPNLAQFKRVKNGLQVTGHNYALIDGQNQPQLKNYYFKLPDAFIDKLKENNVEIQ